MNSQVLLDVDGPMSNRYGQHQRNYGNVIWPILSPVEGSHRMTSMAGEQGFRGPQVCKLVGITYRQLDYWARTDLIRPSLADAQGSGSQRLYSYRDLVALKVVKGLLDSGVSLQTARKALEYLSEHLGEEIASANLVINGNDSVLVRNGEELVDLVQRGQGVLNVVPLGSVVQQLDASLHALIPEVPVETEKAATGS